MSKKLVVGVGVNDCKGSLKSNDRTSFKIYITWHEMLVRCYGNKKKYSSYAGCTVCHEWLTFSNFKLWMEEQEWKGKHLDKDILIQGNRIYSPESCLFVDPSINTMMINNKSNRGLYATGVSFCKINNKFKSYCRINKKSKNLGCFKTEHDAHGAYCDFKYKLIRDVAASQKEPLKSALLSYKIDFR